MNIYTGIYSDVRTYNDIKSMYKSLEQLKKIFSDHGIPFPVEYYEEAKKACRHVYRNYSKREDPLSRSMRGSWRGCIDSDGEGGKHYTIIPDEGQTDEELQEFMYDSPVYYGRINSPYDCTGKRFTRYCDFRRCPAGIIIIHDWGIDI